MTGPHLLKNSYIMETDVSLPHSQQPTTCPYPKPHQSSSSPYPNSCWHIIHPSNSRSSMLSVSRRLPYLNLPYKSHFLHTCHMAYPPTFPLFGYINNIQWTVQIINLPTNRHLPLVLPVCPLPETTCTYHVHCATGSTVSLAMFTQTLERIADGTEVCRSGASVISRWIDRFDGSRDMGAV